MKKLSIFDDFKEYDLLQISVELQLLRELKQKGILTEKEFVEKKCVLLGLR